MKNNNLLNKDKGKLSLKLNHIMQSSNSTQTMPSKFFEGSPVDKRNPRTQFTEQILKAVVGQSRANQVLTSLSMGVIPGACSSAFNINGILNSINLQYLTLMFSTLKSKKWYRDGINVQKLTNQYIAPEQKQKKDYSSWI